MKAVIFKEELKATIREALTEHKEWFIEIFQDAIENDGLVEVMKEAEREFVSRQEVFAAFQEKLEDIQVYDETKSKKEEIIPFKQAVEEIEAQNQKGIPSATVIEEEKLKDTLKSTLNEALAERRAWLTSILFEVIQDYKK